MEPPTILLPDGRRIAYLDGGDPAGYPVIGLHGTPGCRLNRLPDDEVYARTGVRYITTDRAGYGQSSRHRGRSVADEAADVRAVADALGLDRFSVVGGSGGGPHALACAALLDDRVERVACQSSLAPLGEGGMARDAWLWQMEPEAAQALAWVDAGEGALTAEIQAAQARMERLLVSDPASFLGEGMGGADQEVLARPEVVAAFTRIMAEQAAHGVGGSVDDTLAFARPWGFRLEDISIPVLLTYGLQDFSCPPDHGRWLARHLPTALVVEDGAGGHLPQDLEADIARTFSWLRTGQLS
ncbi:Haloalkane dehalogenase [Nocardioides dokdonensis FR1436]|uniref:Haloalkane dehalogenase n=1 Tax=Nocardioides dokdonensis FR1436 TaxID=1300347 RepID=A0A1A9GRS1_9ACTN|nr:alpha/beta hydrolase [Nocardioides dokdonensis]ANH40165.1 Haloalkane dehalogenase [Nocardioides dokdonensis FR1436]